MVLIAGSTKSGKSALSHEYIHTLCAYEIIDLWEPDRESDLKEWREKTYPRILAEKISSIGLADKSAIANQINGAEGPSWYGWHDELPFNDRNIVIRLPRPDPTLLKDAIATDVIQFAKAAEQLHNSVIYVYEYQCMNQISLQDMEGLIAKHGLGDRVKPVLVPPLSADDARQFAQTRMELEKCAIECFNWDDLDKLFEKITADTALPFGVDQLNRFYNLSFEIARSDGATTVSSPHFTAALIQMVPPE